MQRQSHPPSPPARTGARPSAVASGTRGRALTPRPEPPARPFIRAPRHRDRPAGAGQAAFARARGPYTPWGPND